MADFINTRFGLVALKPRHVFDYRVAARKMTLWRYFSNNDGSATGTLMPKWHVDGAIVGMLML